MMNSALKTQAEIKNNEAEIEKFLLEVKEWGKEIKEKEFQIKQLVTLQAAAQKKVEKRPKASAKPPPADEDDDDIQLPSLMAEATISDTVDVKKAANSEKEKGNKYVKKNKWKEACECYTKAIELDPSNHVFYANRALCYMNLDNLKAAEGDCDYAISLDTTYVKAYLRRACIRKQMKKFKDSISDYESVLKLEAKNTQALDGLAEVRKCL